MEDEGIHFIVPAFASSHRHGDDASLSIVFTGMSATNTSQEVEQDSPVSLSPLSSLSSTSSPSSSSPPLQGLLLEKPKRPLSAYNLFFQAHRRKLLAERPVRPEGIPIRRGGGHGKVGFAELAKTVAAKWKAIDPGTKKYYDQMAQQEKIRYKERVAKWKEQQQQQDQDQENSSQKSFQASTTSTKDEEKEKAGKGNESSRSMTVTGFYGELQESARTPSSSLLLSNNNIREGGTQPGFQVYSATATSSFSPDLRACCSSPLFQEEVKEEPQERRMIVSSEDDGGDDDDMNPLLTFPFQDPPQPQQQLVQHQTPCAPPRPTRMLPSYAAAAVLVSPEALSAGEEDSCAGTTIRSSRTSNTSPPLLSFGSKHCYPTTTTTSAFHSTNRATLFGSTAGGAASGEQQPGTGFFPGACSSTTSSSSSWGANTMAGAAPISTGSSPVGEQVTDAIMFPDCAFDNTTSSNPIMGVPSQQQRQGVAGTTDSWHPSLAMRPVPRKDFFTAMAGVTQQEPSLTTSPQTPWITTIPSGVCANSAAAAYWQQQQYPSSACPPPPRALLFAPPTCASVLSTNTSLEKLKQHLNDESLDFFVDLFNQQQNMATTPRTRSSFL
ncbi:hypothetical protein ACA910_002707 [Epithemia clementina (nom. ined.)]